MQKFILIAMTTFMFSGCMSVFNIGHDKSICEEQGCDYRDAGVCGNSYDIYKNWKESKKRAYIDYGCKKSDVNKRIIVIEEEQKWEKY